MLVICHFRIIVLLIETLDAGNIPGAADIPGVLADATTTAMTEVPSSSGAILCVQEVVTHFI